MPAPAPPLSLPCLCLVTDRRQRPDVPLEDIVDRAVSGGVGIVQLREKDLPASQLYTLALRLKDAINGRALLFVNDRIDVAIAAAAHGVQLGETALPLDAAKALAAATAPRNSHRLLLGRSVHSAQGAIAAQSHGADIITLGSVFPTNSHPGAPTGGIPLVKSAAQAVSIPILAIGGVNADNIGGVIDAGASGAAVISAIAASPDPQAASAALAQNMRAAWASRPQHQPAPARQL